MPRTELTYTPQYHCGKHLPIGQKKMELWPCCLRPLWPSTEDASNNSKIHQNPLSPETSISCTRSRTSYWYPHLHRTWRCHQKLVHAAGATWHHYLPLDPQMTHQCQHELVPQGIITCGTNRYWCHMYQHLQVLVPLGVVTKKYWH